MKHYITTALVITALGILPGCFWPFKRKKAEEPKKEVATQVAAQDEVVKF